jgi:hypothetical protein
MDYRKQANEQCTKVRINHLSGIVLQGATMLTMFLLFFPGKFMQDIVIAEMNKKIIGMPLMKIMSTYRSLLVKEGQKDSVQNYKNEAGKNVMKKCKYTKPFANHFLYRDCVDNHNNLQHSGVSIEETWCTHCRVNHVFAFLLAIWRSTLFSHSGASSGIARTKWNFCISENSWHLL